VKSFTWPDIVTAMDHPGLFGPWFSGSSWGGWKSLQRATNALKMSAADVEFFKSVSGGREPPKRKPREVWYVISRRGGKDSVASATATHVAASFCPAGILRPGERAVVACIAVDREQAKIVWSYIRSFFDQIPPLNRMVRRIAESDGIIELKNSVDVLVMTGDHRSLRGRPILLAVLDEVAHFRSSDESRLSDVELYNALLPGMATIPTAQIIGMSSPHRRFGLLFDRWRRHFGGDSDDVVVFQAASHVMNPLLDTRDRDRQMQEDPAKARSEWFGDWRDDLVSFVDSATVDRCVTKGRLELQPRPDIRYVAAVDPSGGSSDSMTLAISHADGERGVLDLVAEWRPPFSPETVVREIADILRRYRLKTVIGDAYAGEWPRERFRVYGIEYILSSMSRSDAYLTLLPAINTPGSIELLDNPRLISQLCALERRVTRSGRDSVNHPSGGHDDVINAAALSLVASALAPKSSADNWLEFMRRQIEDPRYRSDLDPIHPSGPPIGWQSSDEPLVAVVVPTILAKGGSLISGQSPRWCGGVAIVDVKPQEAKQLLDNPAWRSLNRRVAAQLGLTEDQPK
jgi:hypothetical protein